ncbi:hypothetical protein [Granulicella sp. S190]|uniref:hypothetical protein n=1 Tax=Granulicella sp. S190 TaxID=1747226 RepID=UPI00131B33BE|nr:hypothetical protein [Granulicella sp. S190]
MSEHTSLLQLLGAGGFGAIIGWYVYYINRYRRGDVQLTDLVTLVGVLGGGAVLALFPARTDLFGAYGIGLFAGFFGYFLILVILVANSYNFTFEWFLDGRRRKLSDDWEIPGDVRGTVAAMETPKPVIRN